MCKVMVFDKVNRCTVIGVWRLALQLITFFIVSGNLTHKERALIDIVELGNKYIIYIQSTIFFFVLVLFK